MDNCIIIHNIKYCQMVEQATSWPDAFKSVFMLLIGGMIFIALIRSI